MELTRAEFEALAAHGPAARYALLQARAAQLAVLAARVRALAAQGGAQPEWSAPAVERRAAHAAAQPGHRGQTLAMSATPDTVVVHHPTACGQCGAGLAAEPARSVARRQVVDRPPPGAGGDRAPGRDGALPALPRQDDRAVPG